MAALDIRTLAAKLDVGPVSAIHLIAGFIDGVESNRETPAYYGPMFCKLVNSMISGLPDHADEDLEADPSPRPPRPQAPAEAIRPPQVEGAIAIAFADALAPFIAWAEAHARSEDGEALFCTPHPVRSLDGAVVYATAEVRALRELVRVAAGVRLALAGFHHTANVTEPPPISAHNLARLREDLDQAEARSAMNWATLQAIREALEPYAKLAIANRHVAGSTICGITFDRTKDEYTSASVADLRTLMRVAGLLTDEMQAPAPDAGPAEKPEAAAPPPPAEGAAICPVCDMPANGHTHPPDEEEIPF